MSGLTTVEILTSGNISASLAERLSEQPIKELPLKSVLSVRVSLGVGIKCSKLPAKETQEVGSSLRGDSRNEIHNLQRRSTLCYSMA